MVHSQQCDSCTSLEESDHRITNHLSMLAGYVHLKNVALAEEQADPTRDELRLLLKSIGVHIEAVASLHRMLATDRSQAFADLGQHLRNVCSAFRFRPACGFAIADDLELGCVLPLSQLLPITQIFAEVITNAVKHAHTNGGAGVIGVSCRREIEGTILMEVIDQGCGLPKDFDAKAHNGLGFQLVQTLSKQIGGSVDYETSDRGLRFRLTLPSCETPNFVKHTKPTVQETRRTRRNDSTARKAVH